MLLFSSPPLNSYQRKLIDILKEYFGFKEKTTNVRYTGFNYVKGGTWDEVKIVMSVTIPLHWFEGN